MFSIQRLAVEIFHLGFLDSAKCRVDMLGEGWRSTKPAAPQIAQSAWPASCSLLQLLLLVLGEPFPFSSLSNLTPTRENCSCMPVTSF